MKRKVLNPYSKIVSAEIPSRSISLTVTNIHQLIVNLHQMYVSNEILHDDILIVYTKTSSYVFYGYCSLPMQYKTIKYLLKRGYKITI